MTKQNEKGAKRVPELRFKGFTDDWEQRKLGEIFNERKEKSENSNEQLLSVTINDGVVKSDTLDRKSNASKDKSNYKIVNLDDIAYNSMRMWQGSLGVSSYYGIVSPAYTVISVRNVGKDNPYFYKYSFKRSRSLNVFRKHSQGLTPDTWNLKYPLFKQIKYQAPSLIEQEKIGQLFQSLDKTITLHEEKQRQLEQLKKALLQKMFADETGYPVLRFKGFTAKWEQRKPKNYLRESRILGSTGVDAKKLTVKLWGKGVVEKKESISGSSNTRYYIRHAGQLMYGKLDFLHAAFGIVPKELDKYESTADSPAFDIIDGNPKFLLESFLRKEFYLRNGQRANGSRKAKRIHEKDFLEMPILVPYKSEQTKIGNLINSLDKTITLHDKKIQYLKQLKRGLLQKMFV